MEQRQFVYNGQAVRLDGNYDLAKRIVVKATGAAKLGRPHTVVLAFCGVDGSLLCPPVPLATESWPDMEPHIFKLLEGIKAARLRAGCARLTNLMFLLPSGLLVRFRAGHRGSVPTAATALCLPSARVRVFVRMCVYVCVCAYVCVCEISCPLKPRLFVGVHAGLPLDRHLRQASAADAEAVRQVLAGPSR